MAEGGVVKVEITHSTIGTVSIVEPSAVSSTPPVSQTGNTAPAERLAAEQVVAPAVNTLMGSAVVKPDEAVKPPVKHRGLSAFIRGAWTLIFGIAGEAAVYVLDNLGILNLPPGAGVAVGAVLYSIKKYAKPEGLL